MRLFLRANMLGGTGLFAVALALLPAVVEAQINTPALAVTYDAERAKTSLSSCGCFWLEGGTIEGSVLLFKGLGAVANFSGEQGNVASGVGISHISYLAGPRCTLHAPLFGKNHGTLLFGDALFGGIHAFDGAFPAVAAGE